MNSNIQPAKKAYVWGWLPNEIAPVVVGLIEKQNSHHLFTYGKSYRERENAISLSPFELPLKKGTFEPTGLNNIHSCLRDAAPDAWGRRVIQHEFPQLDADELDYMLLSGSNRIGALDFQHSAIHYVPRISSNLQLNELMNAAEFIEKGIPLSKELGRALLEGSSIGGARPKCLVEKNNQYFIAKFSLRNDIYDIIKAEFIAMRLAALIPLQVPNVHLENIIDKKILLVERFDRKRISTGTIRRLMQSGLTLLNLNELEARYASYSDLADIIRQYFIHPKENLKELYKRLVFNILIGNTDDHARNHSAFWDGKNLTLTPAYDLVPQLRSGEETQQAMALQGCQGNLSTLRNVHSIADKFLLSPIEATDIINHQITIIEENWKPLCEEAELPLIEQQKLWKKAIFNPFCFYEWNY